MKPKSLTQKRRVINTPLVEVRVRIHPATLKAMFTLSRKVGFSMAHVAADILDQFAMLDCVKEEIAVVVTPPPAPMTYVEAERTIRQLARSGFTTSQIAAIKRKPYKEIIRELELAS